MKTGKKLKWGIMGAGIIARKMADDELESFVLNAIHRWKSMASRWNANLIYSENTMAKVPESHVVLGSEGHDLLDLDFCLLYTSQSKRDRG